MPGKVNPVIPEVVNQTSFLVIGLDTTVTLAASAGQLQLNVMEPVISFALFTSISYLTNACDTLREKVLAKMTTHDLNTLSVQIHRINASGWEDLGDGSLAMRNFKLKAGCSAEEEEEAKRKHLRQFTSTPYSYMARIRIKYEIPHLI